jgi:hypothetical protein
MDEKKRRGARPTMGLRHGVTHASLDRDGVAALKDAALPAGPEHVQRDNLARLAAHLLTNRPDGDPGLGTTYHAFEALAACAERAQAVADARRAAAGQPPVSDFAREYPDAVVRVPVWALMAIYKGWMRATRGDVADDETRASPLPLNEAFCLGGTGDRTVPLAQRNLARALDIAIAVAELCAREPGVSKSRALVEVAERFNVSEPVARRAWTNHRELAHDILTRAKERSSKSGSQ